MAALGSYSVDEFTEEICLAVNPVVTRVAESDEIVDVVTSFGELGPGHDVMSVKAAFPKLRRTASHASVSVPFEASGDGSLPVLGLVEPLSLRCDAAFPSGITRAKVTSDSGFGYGAARDSVLVHGVDDGGTRDTKYRGHLIDSHPLRNVVLDKPIAMLVGRICSVVARHVSSPSPLRPHPVGDGFAAAAFTQRLRRVSRVLRVGLASSAAGDAVVAENLVDRRRCDAVVLGENSAGNPGAVRVGSCVAANDLLVEFFVQFLEVLLPSHWKEVMPMGAQSVCA